MSWNRIDVDENFEEVNPIPEVHRVNVKVEDWHRTDMPGCPKHPTAGAIMQHTSWSDPDGTRHNRFTGIALCAECSMLLETFSPQSTARSEYDK